MTEIKIEVDDLDGAKVEKLNEELGEEPVTGDPYVGKGKSAEAVSGRNIAKIADAEGVDLDGTDAEKRGYWPREDDD